MSEGHALQPLWTAREVYAYGYPVNRPVSPSPPLNNHTLKFGIVLGEFTGLFLEHRVLSQLCPHLGSSPTAVRPWAFSSRLPALGFPSTALSSLHSHRPALGFITTDIVSTHRQGWFYFSTPLDLFGCLEVRAYTAYIRRCSPGKVNTTSLTAVGLLMKGSRKANGSYFSIRLLPD